ncbi:hypothetical protein GYB14_21430 [bacterium]|nr:hypothetical protein [bacterium]
MPDDFENAVSTTGTISVGGFATGIIEVDNDVDWFATQLDADQYYRIDLVSASNGDVLGLGDPYFLGLRNSQGQIVYGTGDDDGGEGYNSRSIFSVAQSGTYYLAASAFGTSTGAYELNLTAYDFVDDFGADPETSGNFSVGETVSGEIQAGDVYQIQDDDWFAIELTAGESYLFDVSASGNGTSDSGGFPSIEGLYDSEGEYVSEWNDQVAYRGNKVLFTPDESGVYHVSVTNWDYFLEGEGGYELQASIYQRIDDFAATVDTTGILRVGEAATGEIEDNAFLPRADRDWFAVELEEGGVYQFVMSPTDATGSLSYSAVIRGIYDSEGDLIPVMVRNSYYLSNSLFFAPEANGTYFVSASAEWVDVYGAYEISAERIYSFDGYVPDAVASIQIHAYSPNYVDDASSTLVFGSDRDNTIRGISGHDVLLGAEGDDLLIGDDTADGQWLPGIEGAVFRLFEFLLDREPSERELQMGLENAYYSFYGLSDAAAFIIGSPEFDQRWGDLHGADLISFFYERLRGNVVDDDPYREIWLDQLERAYSWGLLPRYAEGEIASAFVLSEEYQSQSSGYDLTGRLVEFENQWGDEVFSSYQAVLGRRPDARGFENWLDRIENGLDLSGLTRMLLTSQEFEQSASGLSDRDFVELVLTNLDDTTSEVEVDFAAAQLDAGLSRDEFVAVQVLLNDDQGFDAWMRARGEDDVLAGGAGNDLLFGGPGSDRFVFAPDEGNDTVADLQSFDIIDLTAFGFADLDAALEAFHQDGDHLVFEAENTRIRFQSEQLAALTDDMLQV